MFEILAPAGSPESLNAAVNVGADAVYLGLSEFSARRKAKNFTEDELYEAAKNCRLSGIRLYLALNTLIYGDEIKQVREAVRIAAKARADAVIIQDLALLDIVREEAPGLKIHASTQMSITSVQGVKAAKELGFSRIVLARELSFGEIKIITEACKELQIETEVFVHGALCVCVSGQCYMSLFFGGDGESRSANRGLCAQPCRLNFTTENTEYALSLKDLSLIDRIPELEAAGVDSIKIEGRMKRPEYVAAAVDACYKARKGEPYDAETLRAAFSRGMFTDGYYTGEISEMRGFRCKEDLLLTEKTLKSLRELYKSSKKRRKLNINLKINSDKDIVCEAECDGVRAEAEFSPAQAAETRETTVADVVTQLSKLGGTIFEAGEIECTIDSGLFLSAARINEIRRRLVDEISRILST
ncbi:MAG: U32 family peptidase [Oscillospiraceae bacterium]|nr:U32 family peptidase [Oscillospiraceae bacterium]